eukprot:s1573_g1.t3
MKTIVKTCDAGDSMQRFVTNSESFTLQLEGDRSLCLDWAARGGFERFETYPVVMRECNNTHSQRWLRVLKVAKLRTSFTDGEESCLSFDNINVEGGACSQAPVWNWRFSTNQLWTKFSDDIPELCLMRIEFVLSIQDVVLAPCDSTKLEQKFTILAERTIHLLEDDGRPGPYLCLDWDVENRYEKDSFRVITTTGALVGDTPDLLKPLSTSFEEIRSTITKELTADPAPDVSCEQIASTTEWLRSIIAAMTEHNSGFSRLGVSQLSDEELQRNQALARETSRQLTVLLAENTKQFRATPMGTVMAFGKGSQSQEVRQNLATFRQFWDKFGDEKWLSGLVAPEFAEKKELAKKLLDKLQGTDKVTLSDSGPICQYCSRNRGNAAFCQYPDCGRCSHGYRYTCQFGCGSSVFFCNRCGSGPRQQGAFCSSCNFCAHGRTKSNGCKKGCSDTQWQTQQTFCCFLHAGTEHGSFTVNVKAKNVTLYNSIAACSEATSKSKLMRLAQMADLLAKACREDAEAMEDAEQKLQTKMDRLKDFAEAINEVPKVLRKFLLIRSGSIKDDLGQLKEWLHKDEVDSTHMQLEEFRDEAAEERVMRRVGQKRALSEGSWLQPKGGAVEPSSTEPCRGTSACAWDTAEWSGCSNDCGDGTMVRSVSCSSGWDADCVEERPSSEMSCRVVAGCNWTISQWSVCDSSCGAGTQSRDASCTSGNAADCASPGPAVTQHCYETAGCSWQIGSWSSCSSGCGVGTRQRSVACSSGRDGDCPANERPTNSEVCYERGGCMWQMDDWGDCSSSCGLGLRTREVWCPSFIEADCEGSGTQPARSESCYGNIGCTWLSGDWSSCSNDCGTGFEVRPITCSSGRESDCLGEGRPLGNRTCFDSSNCAWLVGSWEPCNATCGEGWQARTVRCLGGDASLCPGEAPTALQSCRSQAGCQWLPGEWGPCSSTCEPGTRSRNISCSGTSEADCSQAPRPPDREPCNAQATGAVRRSAIQASESKVNVCSESAWLATPWYLGYYDVEEYERFHRAALFCCCFSFSIEKVEANVAGATNKFVACASCSLCLGGLLCLAALVWMTIRDGWTFFIIWPAACCGCCRIHYACFGERTPRAVEFEADNLEVAEAEIQKRSIRFEGSVIREEGAWERLVAESRQGQVSAAVVFLPDGTKDSGKHDRIPEEEGLTGTCWCTPLYGEQKPWGCRWWTKWMANVELAVKSGAQLDVDFMKGQVGKGKVESFDTAGSEHLRREKIHAKRADFKNSAEFHRASAACLDGLSDERCEDSSSRYGKEFDRLFLAWLPKEDRKGYSYQGVVATWLAEDGSEGRCDWNLGAWSPCSATACLALGSRVREVFCPSQHGDAGCPWPKPKALETCQSSRTCVWEISEWSECDATCGPGEKRRQVRCTSPDEEECPGDRPADREECYSTANCAWWTGTWTPCNATCGDGLQTRTLVCGADACDPTTAPSAVRSCRSTSQCSWQLGAWGGCISGEVLADVSVEDCQNVLQVKIFLRKLNHFPVSLQQLLCDGRCLEDDEQVDGTEELQMLSVVGKEQSQQAENELIAYSAEEGDLSVARSLLQAGVDKNCACALCVEGYWSAMTALLVAARMGQTEMVRLLLHAGANKNLRDVGGRTALANAARVGHTEIVRLLVDFGADMDLQDRQSMTPLIHAASAGHAEIVRLLSDAGADKSWQDQYGRTALAHAAHGGKTDIVRHLASSRCGSGISERSVLCPSGDDVDCSAVPRPLDRRSCHDVTGCNWSTSSWSACSQTCGRGTSTRAVVCPSGDEGDCAGLPRPEAERSCSETVGCSWVLGQWSSCSSSCGNGTRSREVRCPSALSE